SATVDPTIGGWTRFGDEIGEKLTEALSALGSSGFPTVDTTTPNFTNLHKITSPKSNVHAKLPTLPLTHSGRDLNGIWTKIDTAHTLSKRSGQICPDLFTFALISYILVFYSCIHYVASWKVGSVQGRFRIQVLDPWHFKFLSELFCNFSCDCKSLE
ncbi:hypothetical protein AKJ16_DCAP18604, partial [Drosera capensis]